MKVSQLSAINEILEKQVKDLPDAKITESRNDIVLTIRMPKGTMETPEKTRKPRQKKGVDLSDFTIKTPVKPGEYYTVSCAGKVENGSTLIEVVINLLASLGLSSDPEDIKTYLDSPGKTQILAILAGS